jgi:MFS family permease
MAQSNAPQPAPKTAKKDKKALSPEDRRMHIQLALLSLATMINVLGFSIIIPLIPEYVQQGLHLTPQQGLHDPRIAEYGGWLTAIYAFMQFLFAPFWGRLSDRIGRRSILIGSLIGDAIFYAMFGFSTHSIIGQFASRILAGIFSSATLSVAQAYAADITPPHLRAMGLG